MSESTNHTQDFRHLLDSKIDQFQRGAERNIPIQLDYDMLHENFAYYQLTVSEQGKGKLHLEARYYPEQGAQS